MSRAHWSYNALTVKVFNVNAIVFIPLIVAVCFPKFILGFVIFGLVLAYFLIVENWLGMKSVYLPDLLRFKLMGQVRAPKSNNFDF